VARAAKAGIDVTVDERPAIAGLKRLTKEFGSTAVAINQAAELGLKAWGAITGVIGGAVSAVVDATKASMEVERVERRAFAAMQTRAGMTREEFAALGALNDQRERQLNIDADEQLQLQGTLAALGLRKEALNAATEATIGLAEVTGQGLAEAGKKVAQVLGGNVNALKELGIRASSAADAQRQLQDLFVLATAQADTLETRVAAVGHAYGSMTETLGATITQSRAAKDMTDAMTDALGDLTAYLSSEEGKRAVDQFFRYFALGVAMAIDSLEDLRVGTIDTINWFKKNFTDQVVVESLDPEPSTLRKLSAKLFQIYQGAVELTPPIDAGSTLVGPPRPPGTGGAGNGGGGAARKQDRTRHIAVDQEMFGPTEAEQFRALNERLAADARLMEMERGVAQREAARSEFEQRMALMQELHDREIEFSASMSTAMLEQTSAEADARQQTLASVAAQTRDTLGQQMAQMVVAVASGEQSLGKALESFVGGIVTSLGTMLIQLGTAAIAANLLSVVPVLGALVGPPGAGVGAGLAAIAAGASMVALGSLMGGGARAGGSTAPPMTGGGGGSAPRAPSLDTGRVFMPSFAMAGAAATPYTVNVNFNGIVGDERRAARMIEDTLRRGR
jgi:hypothetical protein